MEQPRRRPGRPRGNDGETRERVLDAARDLFSSRGFEGVSLREIAAAVGVDVATVHHHAGSKGELYEAVFRRMSAAESAVLDDAALLVADKGVMGLHDVLDAYLEFLDSHPEVTYLWLRRWLEPAHHRRLDEEYALPLYRFVESLLPEEPQAHAAVRSFVWAIHGHVTAMAAARGRERERERADFRAFAHRLVDALWG